MRLLLDNLQVGGLWWGCGGAVVGLCWGLWWGCGGAVLGPVVGPWVAMAAGMLVNFGGCVNWAVRLS